MKNLPRTGPSIYIAAYNCNGITTNAHLTFQCQDMPSSNSNGDKHNSPSCPQHCPYYLQPKQYGSSAQCPIPPDTSPLLSNDDIKHVQRVISSILFYARAVDLAVLMALSSIASKHWKEQIQPWKNANNSLITLHPIPMPPYVFTPPTWSSIFIPTHCIYPN